MKHRSLKIILVFVVIPVLLIALTAGIFAILKQEKKKKPDLLNVEYSDQESARANVGELIPILTVEAKRFTLDTHFSEDGELLRATAKYVLNDKTEYIVQLTDKPFTTKNVWTNETHSIGYNVYEESHNSLTVQFCIQYHNNWFRVWIYPGEKEMTAETCLKEFIAALEA